MATIVKITNDQIIAMRTAAEQIEHAAQVEMCDLALAGNQVGIEACQAVADRDAAWRKKDANAFRVLSTRDYDFPGALIEAEKNIAPVG